MLIKKNMIRSIWISGIRRIFLDFLNINFCVSYFRPENIKNLNNTDTIQKAMFTINRWINLTFGVNKKKLMEL